MAEFSISPNYSGRWELKYNLKKGEKK